MVQDIPAELDGLQGEVLLVWSGWEERGRGRGGRKGRRERREGKEIKGRGRMREGGEKRWEGSEGERAARFITHLFIPGRFPQKYLALLAAEIFLASTTTGLH